MRPGAEAAGLDPLWLSACLALFALVLLPVALSRMPPLQDYINHLARIHVIALNGSDALLDRFYGIEWKLIPNLAMDLVVPPLVPLIGLYAAGKLFVLAYMALLVTGPHAVHYALFRRHSLGPLVAVLFVYNEMSTWGFVNYLFGVGLALWGVAAWIGLRGARVRAAVSLVFIVALFFCHLSAVGLYGLALFGYEAWRWLTGGASGRQQRLADAFALVVPFLVVPALLAFSPIGNAPIVGPDWQFGDKYKGLWAIFRAYVGPVDKALAIVIAGAALWAWWRRVLRVHPAGWLFLAALVPVYLALPTDMMSGSSVDVRVPIGALFILLGFVDWHFATPAMRRGFLVVLGLIALVRIAAMEVLWQRMDAIAADFEVSLERIALGSKVIMAEADFLSPLYPMRYLACLAMIERSSLVSIAFANPHHHILTVKPPYRDIGNDNGVTLSVGELLDPPPDPPPGTLHGKKVYWRNWWRDYDYLYVMWTGTEPNPAPEHLTEIYAGTAFRLYRIVPPS